MRFAAIAVLAAGAALLTVRALHGRRARSERDVAGEVCVTLSVLPSRTAVVMLDRGADAPSAARSRLVEHAVREAFGFTSVDVVEVRGRDGRLLDRQRRCSPPGRPSYLRRRDKEGAGIGRRR